MNGLTLRRGLLLPLRDQRAPQPGRALQDRGARRLAGARALRVLLVRRLHARLLQRLRGDGARGRPRLRGLPRRLHLRRHPAHHARAARPCATTTTRRRPKTLADYRAKYALYRSDAALRKHARALPDRLALGRPRGLNDYAGSLPDGGLPAAAATRVARRNAAYQAFFEAMPFVPSGRSRIYRTLRFGRHAELILLDERQYRADQPCGDTVGPDCAERHVAAAVPRRQAARVRRRRA